ncbi:hypothetical protein [Brachybacterium sp. YJGR34]|uniref:hypothetical protein n=1 Tax=Brachybacterium sp. YJGR34 TaxID=2059911 RepID=UPI001300447B|nr:hypothetical protein [Brachybacterium sp. YJGR34]
MHTAPQALLGDDWVLVDATHDPPLARLGLPVGTWDGTQGTRPAYDVIGEVVALDDPRAEERLAQSRSRIAGQVEATDPEAVQAYLRDLNALLESVRSEGAASV